MSDPQGRPYDEYGGRRSHPAAYDGAIDRDCPACKAPAGQVCTFLAETFINGVPGKTTKNRHHPCIARTKGQ